MTSLDLQRWSGASLALGGASLALFSLSHPWNQLAGAHVGRSVAWMLSHGFHFHGGMLLLLRLLGFAVVRPRGLGRTGWKAFLTAFVGTARFAGTGRFTAFLWPVLAHHAPSLTESVTDSR